MTVCNDVRRAASCHTRTADHNEKGKPGLSMDRFSRIGQTHFRLTAISQACLLGLCLMSGNALANERDQAKRIYDRLTGTPPSEAMLDTLESLVNGGQARDAALMAMDQDGFYDITLKNMVTPWTNEAADSFAPLNDYTATVIGMTRDDVDFRLILSADLLYVGDQAALNTDGYSVASVSASNNDHYEDMEQQAVPLKDYLVSTTQSSVYPLPSEATAGVMTSRAGAHAFFVGGTNRAMFRFTLINHMCRDLEQVKDLTRPADRVRQDVTRSPGGDSRIYLNSCVGCHSGMDPMAQAFAYYDWSGEEGTDDGAIIYNGPGFIDPDTGSRVQGKYLINATNFPHGFITEDDHWDNYWRSGPNANLGWGAGTGSGDGAKSLGQELANSDTFASCQAQKVFHTVCLREPHSNADVSQIDTMATSFSSGGYVLRDLFADAAVYCMGD